MMNMIFGFKGRIGRGTFWMIQAGQIAAAIAMFMLFKSAILSTLVNLSQAEVQPDAADLSMFWIKGAPVFLFILLMLWINVGSFVKRLHDRDKSGWWLMAYFVPALLGKFVPEALIIAGLVQLWFFVELGFLSGTNGPNRFDGESISFKEFDDAKGPFAKRTPASSASPAKGGNAAPQAFAQPPRTFNATPGGGFGRRGL